MPKKLLLNDTESSYLKSLYLAGLSIYRISTLKLNDKTFSYPFIFKLLKNERTQQKELYEKYKHFFSHITSFLRHKYRFSFQDNSPIATRIRK